MTDVLTWPAAFMGAFTIINGSVLVPVVRSWRRNRSAGKARDAVLDALNSSVNELSRAVEKGADRTESSLRELGAKLEALSRSSWETKARVDVLETQVRYLAAELERLRESM